MVVGIKHTSSATSTVIDTAEPDFAMSTAKIENGSSVTVAIRNTSVSATSKMVSAASFGVLRRLAPSTIEIMRSRNEAPGLTVQRTTIQSDSTRVPPVTDEKSPPASRMTGADSPVIALSSTEATPSITSPSQGIMSPASTSSTTPMRSSSVSTGNHDEPYFGCCNFLAMPCFFRPRRLAACALLRPSASASAKLANSKVNHSHSAFAPMNQAGDFSTTVSGANNACSHSPLIRIAPM